MRLVSYAETLFDLNLLKDQGMTEVILGHRDLSRFGKLSTEEFMTLSTRARELGMKVTCEWDILMTENTFAQAAKTATEILSHADILRVQDPGALEWAIHQSTLPLQFIAENGNHNLSALQGWIDIAQGRMERIVLSIELSRDVIAEYTQKLTVPCELLGFGRILLFYTPRSLLSPLAGEKLSMNDEISALGESEESPHKGFPILENRHGTFMFHIKEFCLLEYAADLANVGLGVLRIDTRFGMGEYARDIFSLVSSFAGGAFEAFKERYPQDLMRGFYLVNKTDVLFPKLKNSRLQKRDGNFIGDVLDAEKGSHLAILVKNPRGLKKTDQLRILHPKGEEFEVKIHSLRNLSLEDVEVVEVDQIAIIPFVNGVWVKSQVFFL